MMVEVPIASTREERSRIRPHQTQATSRSGGSPVCTSRLPRTDGDHGLPNPCRRLVIVGPTTVFGVKVLDGRVERLRSVEERPV